MSFSRAPLLRFNEPKRRINPLGKSNSPTRTQQTAKSGRKSDNALAQTAAVGKQSSSTSVPKEHHDKTDRKPSGKHPDQKLSLRRTTSERSITTPGMERKEENKTTVSATRATPDRDVRQDSPDKNSGGVLSGDKRRGQLLEVSYQENKRKFMVAKRDLRDKQKVIDQLYSSLQEIQLRYKEVTGRELADVDAEEQFNETEGRSLAASSDGGSKRSVEDSDSTTLKAHSVKEEGVGSWMLNSLQNISEKYIELCKDVIKKRDDLIGLVDNLLSSHEHGLTDELKRQVQEYQKEAEQFDEYMDLVRRLQLRSVASLGDALRDLVSEHERVKTELTEALAHKMKLEQDREESAAVARREAERQAAAQAELRARLAEVTEELGGERQRSQRLTAQTALLGQQLQQANVHVQETEARLKETTGQLMQVKDAARNNQVHMQNLATEKIDLLREYTEIKQKADEEVEEVVREMETRLEQVNKRLQEEMHMSQRLRQQNWSFRRLLVEADKKAKRNLMMLCHRSMQTESPCESDDETTDATACSNNRGSQSKGNDSSDSDFACESLATDSETPHVATPLRESIKSGDLTTDSSHKRLEEKGSHYPTEVTYTNPTSNEESSNESVCGLVMSDKPATGGGASSCSFTDEDDDEDADGEKTVVETKHKPQVVKSMPAARKIEKIIVVRCLRSKDDKDKGKNKTEETSLSSSMVFEDARETHSNDSFAASGSEPCTDAILPPVTRRASPPPARLSSQSPPPPPTPPSPPSPRTVLCLGHCCGSEEEEEETDDVCRRLEEEKRRMREQRHALEAECRQIANEKAELERDIQNASLMEKDLGERFQKEFSKMLMNELLPKEQEIEQLQHKVEELSAMVDYNKTQFSEYEGKMKELASSLSAPVVEGSQLALQDMVAGLRNHVSCMREALSAMRDRNAALEKALAAKGAEAAAQAQLARRQGLALQARDARLLALQATMRQRDKHAQKIEREVHMQTQQLSQLQMQLETRDLQLKRLTTMVHDLSEHCKSRGAILSSAESGDKASSIACGPPPPAQQLPTPPQHLHPPQPPPPPSAQAASAAVPQLSATTLQLLKPLPPPQNRAPENHLAQQPSFQQQPILMRPPSSTTLMLQQQQQQQQQQQLTSPQESSPNPSAPSVHLLHPPQFLARQRQYIPTRRLNVSLAPDVHQQQMQPQQLLKPQQAQPQQQLHMQQQMLVQQQMETNKQMQAQQQQRHAHQMPAHQLLQTQQHRQPQVATQQIQSQQIPTQQVTAQQQMEAQQQIQSHLQPHLQAQHMQMRQQCKQAQQVMQTQQQQMEVQQHMEGQQQIQAQQKMQTQQKLQAQQQLKAQQLQSQHVQTQHKGQTPQIHTREPLKTEIYENLYQSPQELHPPVNSNMMSQIVHQCQVMDNDVRYLSHKNSYPTADSLEQCAETEDSGIFSRHQLQEGEERAWGTKSQSLLMVSSDSFSPIRHTSMCVNPPSPPMSSQALNTRPEQSSNSNIPLIYRMQESSSDYISEHQNGQSIVKAVSTAPQSYLPANISNSSYQDVEELRTHQQPKSRPLNDTAREHAPANIGEFCTRPYGMAQLNEEQDPIIGEIHSQNSPFSLLDINTECPSFNTGELLCPPQAVSYTIGDLKREHTSSSICDFLNIQTSPSYLLADTSPTQSPSNIGDLRRQQHAVSYPQKDVAREQTSYSFFTNGQNMNVARSSPNATHALPDTYSRFPSFYHSDCPGEEPDVPEREINELSYIHNQVYSEDPTSMEICPDAKEGSCHHKMSVFYGSNKSQIEIAESNTEQDRFVDAYNFFYNPNVASTEISEPKVIPPPPPPPIERQISPTERPIRYTTYYPPEAEDGPSDDYPPESLPPEEAQPEAEASSRLLLNKLLPRINYEDNHDDRGDDNCQECGLGANAAAAAVAAATVAMATVAAMRRSTVANPSLHSVLAQTIASVAQKPSSHPQTSAPSAADPRPRELSAPPALHNRGARPFSDVCKWVAEAASRAKEKTQVTRQATWAPKGTPKSQLLVSDSADSCADGETRGVPLGESTNKPQDRCDCCVDGACFGGTGRGRENEAPHCDIVPRVSSEDNTNTNASDDMASEITALLQSRRARSASAAMATPGSAPKTSLRSPTTLRGAAVAAATEVGTKIVKASATAFADYWRERIASVGDRMERIRAAGLPSGTPDAKGPPCAPLPCAPPTTPTRGTPRIEVPTKTTAVAPVNGQHRAVASPPSDSVSLPLKEEEEEAEDDFLLTHPSQTLKMLPSPITAARHMEKDAFRLQEPLSGLEAAIFQMSSLHHRSDNKTKRALLDPLEKSIPPKLRPSRKRTLLSWELPLRMNPSSNKAPSDEEAEKELVVRELQDTAAVEEPNRCVGRRRGRRELVTSRRNLSAGGEMPLSQIQTSRSVSPRGRTTRTECLVSEPRKVTFSPLLKVSLIEKNDVERPREGRVDVGKKKQLSSISQEIVSLPLKWSGFPWPVVSKREKLPEKRGGKSSKAAERVESPSEMTPTLCKNCISAVSPFYSFIEDHIVDSSYRDSSEDDTTINMTKKTDIGGLSKFLTPENLWYLKPSCDMKKITYQTSKIRRLYTKAARKSSLDSRLTALSLEENPLMPTPPYDVFKPSKMLSGDTSPTSPQTLDDSLEDITKADDRRVLQRVGIRASKRLSPLRLVSELPKIVEHTEESSGDSASFQSISRWAMEKPTKSASNFNEQDFNTAEACDTSTSETRVLGTEGKDSVRRSPSSSDIFYRTRSESPGTKDKVFLQNPNGFVESLESLIDSHKNTDREPTSNVSKSLSSHSEEDQLQSEARSFLGTARDDWKTDRKALNFRKKKGNRLYRQHALPSESGSSSSGAKIQRHMNFSLLNKRGKFKRQVPMSSLKTPTKNDAESFVAYSYLSCCPHSGDNVCTHKLLKRNIPELHIVDANCTYHGS